MGRDSAFYLKELIMTPQDKKETVRQAIAKTNPHLNNMEKICSECKRQVVSTGVRVVRKKPIQFADVLIAIQNTGVGICFYGADKMWLVMTKNLKKNRTGYENTTWNLLDDFDHQSEEVYDFLWELLHD